MARKKKISDEIREQVIAIVNQFNEENPVELLSNRKPKFFQRLFGKTKSYEAETGLRYGDYVPRFRGAFLYLDRVGLNGVPFEVCRLKWTGDFTGWEFAIYKHSKNGYDPDEWFFPGAGEVDGTILGALRAGDEAYPV